MKHSPVEWGVFCSVLVVYAKRKKPKKPVVWTTDDLRVDETKLVMKLVQSGVKFCIPKETFPARLVCAQMLVSLKRCRREETKQMTGSRRGRKMYVLWLIIKSWMIEEEGKELYIICCILYVVCYMLYIIYNIEYIPVS